MSIQIIKKPIITERSVALAKSDNTYTFLVTKTAKKNQIAQAVAKLFKVEVQKVRTVTVPFKIKKSGKKRLLTTKAAGKKAMVSVKAGQTIDLFDFGGKN